MNLQLDRNQVPNTEVPKKLWRDNGMWWVNCLAIERFWYYAGNDLNVARGRRDAMLISLVESW